MIRVGLRRGNTREGGERKKRARRQRRERGMASPPPLDRWKKRQVLRHTANVKTEDVGAARGKRGAAPTSAAIPSHPLLQPRSSAAVPTSPGAWSRTRDRRRPRHASTLPPPPPRGVWRWRFPRGGGPRRRCLRRHAGHVGQEQSGEGRMAPPPGGARTARWEGVRHIGAVGQTAGRASGHRLPLPHWVDTGGSTLAVLRGSRWRREGGGGGERLRGREGGWVGAGSLRHRQAAPRRAPAATPIWGSRGGCHAGAPAIQRRGRGWGPNPVVPR